MNTPIASLSNLALPVTTLREVERDIKLILVAD